ncbi:conserved hypothetical protein [Mucor ambiguus]|uniref:BAR domain-containing protein n=1 Tax=Mucor ambiguus TaxID=91626 RepID=A0A0C9MGM2_9FUNG|nr:conserved hypothetical protein [Mucor ambiguus]
MSTPTAATDANLIPSAKPNTADASPTIEEAAPAIVEQPAVQVNENQEPNVTSSVTAKKPEHDQNEIRVAQDEPALDVAQDANNRRNSAINPSAILETTIEGLATISSKINPLTERLGKGLDQVRQYAQEKFGTADEITELPQEYKDLEKRVDTIARVHQNFLKVAKTYNTPNYDYPVQIQESFIGFTNTVTNQIQQLRNKPDRAQTVEHPKTLSHAIGRVALDGAMEVGHDEVFGVALDKLGNVSNKLGDARLAMDSEIVTNFNTPIQVTLKTAIEGANKARRNVQVKRLALDAAKTNYRESPTVKLDAARSQVEQAEDQFVGAVEEATHLMKTVLEDPEPLRDLADYAQIQLAYFKQAQELFSGLVPELEEIRVTQESMYRDNDE